MSDKMKFIKLNIQFSWGKKIIFVNLKNLKSLSYDEFPGYIHIYFLDHDYEGFLEDTFDEEKFFNFLHNTQKIFEISLKDLSACPD